MCLCKIRKWAFRWLFQGLQKENNAFVVANNISDDFVSYVRWLLLPEKNKDEFGELLVDSISFMQYLYRKKVTNNQNINLATPKP